MSTELGHLRNSIGGETVKHLERLEVGNLSPVEDARKGWCTTNANRPEIVANLVGLATQASHLFTSPRLLREMKSLVRHADGISRATSGAHDDCVMAIAQQVRAEVPTVPK